MREFFTSYARLDAKGDTALREFVQHLSTFVQRGCFPQVKPDEVCFFDVEDIVTGQRWKDVLGKAVATCKVCVCICSPNYFSSDYCGKEVEIFHQRLSERRTQHGDDTAFIVPVIWINRPEAYPERFAEFNLHHAALPELYIELGLQDLMYQETTDRGSPYWRVVAAIRDLIVAARNNAQPLPHHAGANDFEQIPNFFKPSPAPYGATVFVAAPDGLAWKPFALESAMETWIPGVLDSKNIPLRLEPGGSGLPGQTLSVAPAHRGIAILVEPVAASQQDPQTIALLKSGASMSAVSKAVFAVWGDSAAGTLEGQRKAMLDEMRTALPGTEVTAVDSPSQLREAIEKFVARLQTDISGHAPVRKARDAGAEANASAQGIPLDAPATLQASAGQSR